MTLFWTDVVYFDLFQAFHPVRKLDLDLCELVLVMGALVVSTILVPGLYVAQ